MWLYMHPRLAVAKKGVTGIWKDLPAARPRPVRGRLGARQVTGARARVRRYVARRVAALAATLLFVSVLVFVVVRVLPGDPAAAHHGHRGQPRGHRARCGSRWGSNRPLAVQYVEWLGAGAARRPRPLDPVRRAGRPS